MLDRSVSEGYTVGDTSGSGRRHQVSTKCCKRRQKVFPAGDTGVANVATLMSHIGNSSVA